LNSFTETTTTTTTSHQVVVIYINNNEKKKRKKKNNNSTSKRPKRKKKVQHSAWRISFLILLLLFGWFLLCWAAKDYCDIPRAKTLGTGQSSVSTPPTTA
jgi:ATP-dependent Zn protease